MAAKASIDLTDTVSPLKKIDLTDTVCPPQKIDLTDTKKKFRDELLGLLKCQPDKFSAETSRCCGSSFLAGVKIDGIGILPLPVTPYAAAAVKKVCEVAPNGKGHETVVDMHLRRALQIDSAKKSVVSLSHEFLQTVVNMVKECMDIMGVYGKVEAILYKILYYETGGHFDWHRDTVRC